MCPSLSSPREGILLPPHLPKSFICDPCSWGPGSGPHLEGQKTDHLIWKLSQETAAATGLASTPSLLG